MCQLQDFEGLAPAVQTRGFDNGIKITQPAWHSFSFVFSEACRSSLKMCQRSSQERGGFLTCCRTCATGQTGKDVHCSSGRQMKQMMDISDRALRVLQDLAAHPLLPFCSAGAWEMIWTAASHLPSRHRVQGCGSSAETWREIEWSQLRASGSCRKWEAQTRSTGSKKRPTGEESHCNAVMETALAGTRGFVPPPTGVWYNHCGTYGCVEHSPQGTITQIASRFEAIQESSVM